MCVLDKGAGAGLLLDAAVAAGEVCPGWAAFQQSSSTERMSSAYLGDSRSLSPSCVMQMEPLPIPTLRASTPASMRFLA